MRRGTDNVCLYVCIIITYHHTGMATYHHPSPVSSIDPEAGCPNFFEGKNPSLTYKRIPIFDNRGEDILQYMEGAISFIEQVETHIYI